jgi:ubiquinone/menaquinone biosynthesis C-methylase UbiE
MVTTTASLKELAIDQHSRQADQFAERYRSSAASAYRSCFAYSRRRLEHRLTRLLPDRADGLRLLDVGCGTGHHMAWLGARGFEVSGVDGSPEMLKHARVLNPKADIQLSDVDHLPFPDATFDYVTCIEVLRYLPTASHAIAEIARVLKPGGVCLATAAPLLSLNAYWAVNRVACVARIRDLVRLKQFFHTSGQLRRALSPALFHEVEIQGVYLGPINWVERLAPRTLPSLLKSWEPIDSAVSNITLVREVSNMFLVKAVRNSRCGGSGSMHTRECFQ